MAQTPDQDAIFQLTPEEIAAVRESFATLDLHRALATTKLYDYLFELEPETRALFTKDPRKRQEMFLVALKTCVVSLDKPRMISDYLRGLALRHQKYKVKPHHYKTLEEAFLRTLEDLLGNAFTPFLRDAWRKTYWQIARQMIDIPSTLVAQWKLEWIFHRSDQG